MMNINPVFIGKAELDALEGLRQRASAHPVDILAVMELLKTPAGKRRHMRQMNAQTIHIPFNYYVTYSIETGHPAGTCRHMSMSSGRKGKVPTEHAVWMICKELGFQGGLEQCNFWIEDLSDGEKAINVVQPVAIQENKRAREN